MTSEAKKILQIQNKIGELEKELSEYDKLCKKFDNVGKNFIIHISKNVNYAKSWQPTVTAYTKKFGDFNSAIENIRTKLTKYRSAIDSIYKEEGNDEKANKMIQKYDKYSNKMSSMAVILNDGKKNLNEIINKMTWVVSSKTEDSDELSEILKNINTVITTLVKNKDQLLQTFNLIKSLGVF